MEKENIDYETYQKYSEKALYPYKGVNVNDIINIHKYLKNKIINDREDHDACKLFAMELMDRPIYPPCYDSVIDEFYNSDYLSNEIKEIIKNNDYSNHVLDLLNNSRPFNEFNCEEINEIVNEMNNGQTIRKSMYFEDYLFFLNGNGPVEYIKSIYDEKKLAKLIIVNSGVSDFKNNGYDGIDIIRFNENNLLSIYDKYCKFFPKYKDDFFDFVNLVRYLTHNNFVDNYETFINNYFSSCIPYMEDNEWYDKLSRAYQVEYDKINDNMHMNFNIEALQKEKVLKLKQF